MGLRHSTPELNFGRARCGVCPIVFLQRNISDELLRFLQTAAVFRAEGSELVKHGYQREVDYPEVPGHIYYEAYYHSKPTKASIPSINPRYGHMYEKLTAPIQLVAFCESIRRKNIFWRKTVLEELSCLSSPASRIISELIHANMHFAGKVIISILLIN
jgi:hypothetical protein